MNDPETRRFLVTTPGLCATRWLSFVLASRPDVFVTHGKHALDSVIHGRFESERQLGDASSLALGNVMSSFYRCRSLTEVFEHYSSLMPGAAAIGNVHSYTLSEVMQRFGPGGNVTVGKLESGKLATENLEAIRIANLVRHPVSYIASHTAMVLSAADYLPLREHYQRMFTEVLEHRPELLDIPCQGRPAIEAFVVSCYSASRFLDDLRIDDVPHVRMEDLTSNVDHLTEFCKRLTQLSYDRQRLAGFINQGPINRHRKNQPHDTSHDIYNQWQPWQRHVAAVLLSDELIERFASAKYDVSMLRSEDRRMLAQIRSTASSSSGRLADCVGKPPALGWSDDSSLVSPVLIEEGYRGFNIVLFRKKQYALSQSLGPVDLAAVDDAWISAGRQAGKIAIAEALDETKKLIDQLIGDEGQ
jgi:hypothetical protein